MKKNWALNAGRCGAVAALVVAGLGAAPANAAVRVADITCQGSDTETFDPGITNTTRVLSNGFEENYSCTSLTTRVSNGEMTSARVITANCLLGAASNPQETVTYYWNQGQLASTVVFTQITRATAADGTTTITSTGAIYEGYAIGSSVRKVVVLPQLSPTACASTGVTSVTGTATLSIL